MEIVVSSIAQKRDLITLDLLGSNRSSKALDPPLQISSDNDDLLPLDLNRAPDDGALRPAALPGSQSVCTIEKVKRALERETERQRGGGGGGSASTSASPSPSSSSSSVTTASIKRRADKGDEGSADGGDGDSSSAAAAASGSLVVAGCPGCLSYVMISKENPRCPRCDVRLAAASVLSPPPPPPTKKRPRNDLNFWLSTL